MKDAKGTTAAISAAVTAYMQEEQAAAEAQSQVRTAPASSAWSSSGRGDQMRMRTLWQLRIVPLGRGRQ